MRKTCDSAALDADVVIAEKKTEKDHGEELSWGCVLVAVMVLVVAGGVMAFDGELVVFDRSL